MVMAVLAWQLVSIEPASAQFLFAITVRSAIFGEPHESFTGIQVAFTGQESTSQVYLRTVQFFLKPGEGRTVSNADFPTGKARCLVAQVDPLDVPIVYENRSSGGTIQPGIPVGEPNWFGSFGFSAVTTTSAIASDGVVTITDQFVGDIVITKSVIGQAPQASTEYAIACNNGQVRESFALSDKEIKTYTKIPSGTACFITPPNSPTGTIRIVDNFVTSSSTAEDGRFVVKGSNDCGGVATIATGKCRSVVLLEETYAPPATQPPATTLPTATPTTVAPGTTPAQPVTTLAKPTTKKTTTKKPVAKKPATRRVTTRKPR